MKTITILFATCFSFSAFAGGTGGGGVLRGVMAMKSPIVYTYEVSETGAKFAIGQFNRDQWQLSVIKIHRNELLTNLPLYEAVQDSMSNGDWVKVQD